MKLSRCTASFLLLQGLCAAGTITLIDPGALTNPVTSIFLAPGSSQIVLFPGQTYTNNGATFSATSVSYVYPSRNDGGWDLYNPTHDGGVIRIALSSAANLFGLDADTTPRAGATPPYGQGFNITSVKFFADNSFTNEVGTYSTVTLVDHFNSFFGLANTTPFQSLQINVACPCLGAGFSPYLDDFKVQSTVPEPADAAMAAFGLAMIGWAALGLRRAVRS